jgi:uncharacterized protein YndB with AHSA1/START domain
MAITLQSSTLIDRPVEKVFAFLSLPANHARFIPGMLEFNQTSAGPFGQVGATVRGRRRLLGRSMDLPYEITQYEPNRGLAMKGRMGPVSFEDGYRLEPAGNETRVTFWLRFMPAGAMILAMPILLPWGKLHGLETIANLKRVLRDVE